MAESLKNMFGPAMVHRAASSISAVDGDFDVDRFTTRALDGFDDLELTPRCHQIAAAMAEFLPADQRQAIAIVVDSLGPELENCDPADGSPTGDPEIDDNPMSGFFYMPHGYFIAGLGTAHLDEVLGANYEITKRATSEFSIRTPLRDETAATLAVLNTWATDPNVHVRRLVSEGTRPRLPWSFRLRAFQDDPRPVIALLELLKDDPIEYVRRSVANNLNDISKDHPATVIGVARRWWVDADDHRRRLIRHGLRTLIKAGHPEALDVLGYGSHSPARIRAVSIEPAEVAIGGSISIEIGVENPSTTVCAALVDLRVHFVKANGSTNPKVFKGAELQLDPGGDQTVRKKVSVKQHSTRTHYPGRHAVDVMINGRVESIGAFTLVET